jgi:peptidoglycan-N-acetylglucosamine deacetylase
VALSSLSDSARRFGGVSLCVGLVLGACARPQEDDRQRRGEANVGSTSERLRSESEYYVAADAASGLSAKQLALTFDDGPGARTSELSTYLKGQNIRAVFFVNGACVATTSLSPNDSCSTPTPNAPAILAQLANDGHLVANHTTTHRDMATEVPANQRLQQLAETDALITLHAKTPWNRLLFRAPYGSWSAAAFNSVQPTFSHYVGPIYWDIGGGPTDQSAAATMAADWECWDFNPSYTPAQCGDRYRNEIATYGRGIVLMHDSWPFTTVDMVKYLVPLLKADGYTFVRADEIPRIAADFPACGGAGCAFCSGPAANQCLSCTSGHYLSSGTCAACSTCSAGTYEAAACSANADTTCAPCHASCTACSGPEASQCNTCPNGFYLSGGACLACGACAAGSYASAGCTPSANTTCTPCAPGTFTTDAGATTCTSCGSCDDGDPCTTDSCTATTGCIHAPIPGCSAGSSGTSGGSSGTSGGASDASTPLDDASTGSTPGPRGGEDGCNAGGRTSTPSFAWLFGVAGLVLARRRRTGCARS